MAPVTYLDTHIVAWLYDDGFRNLPRKAVTNINSCGALKISPMVQLELQYLFEIGRVTTPAQPVLDELGALTGLTLCNLPFPAVVKQAETQTWTRDPFDRIIVAQANLAEASLVTKDNAMHAHYGRAVWE